MHSPCHHRPCDARANRPRQAESEQAGAQDPISRARAIPFSARTTHLPRPRPFRRGRLGRAGLEIRAHDPTGVRDPACPAESHLSHLIPLNPGKSRLEKVAVFPRASSTLACAHLRSSRASARRSSDVNRCRAFVARVPARRYSRPADAALAGRATDRTTERSVPVGERSRRRGGAGALAPVGNPPHALKNEEEARSPRGSRRTACEIE